MILSEKYVELVKSTVLFSKLNDDEFDKALTLFEAKITGYSKNDFVHIPYTKMSKFGLVLSGVVQVCTDDIEGNRVIMAEVTPGVTFGESLCFLKIENSPVYAYASEPAEVLWLSIENPYNFNDEFSVIMQKKFTSMLATRTLTMNNRIQVLSKIKLRDKLLTYFNQMSRATGSLTFTIPLNREDLAAYMGTDRSALCRELSKMKQDGLIDYYKYSFRLNK